MPRRYFHPAPIDPPTVTLGGSEAHHLLHVVRVQPGDGIVVFDGHGREYEAKVIRRRRGEVDVQVGPAQLVDRELNFSLAVGVPLPKGDRARWLVEKLTELGVSHVTPLTTARSERLRGSEVEKLQRYIIEASKQCGRNRLMEIGPPVGWLAWIEAASGDCKLVAHPGGEPLRILDAGRSMDLRLAFGPEGGLTDEEVQAAVGAGWQAVDLGPRILRVESAAVSLAAALILARQ